MANPYYVQPLGGLNLGQAYTNAAQGMQARKDKTAATAREQEALQMARQAYATGDPDQIAMVSLQYPELAGQLNESVGFKNEITRQNMIATLRSGVAEPSRIPELIQKRVDLVERQGGDPTETLAELERYKADPEGYAQGLQQSLALMDPAGYKAYREATGGDGKDFDKATKLRKEFSDQSKDFIKQNASFGRIQASVNNPSAAGDLALIFNYMKLLDPGSTVREGEFATAQNSAGVPERIRAKVNEVVRGERLAPEQRSDFYNRAIDLFAESNKQHQKTKSRYSNLAKRNNLPAEDVVIDFLTADQGREVDLGGGPPEQQPPAGFTLMIDASGNQAYVNSETGEIKEL